MVSLYLSIQVFSSYKVQDHFRAVLRECADVTQNNYPHHYANKIEGGKKGKNVSKITLKWQREIMLFLVRLHYSVHVYNTAYIQEKDAEKVQFDFETFPKLKRCLDQLECGFKKDSGDELVDKGTSKHDGKSFESVANDCVALLKSVERNFKDLEAKMSRSRKLVGTLVKMHKENTSALPPKAKEIFGKQMKSMMEEMVKTMVKKETLKGQTKNSDDDGSSASSVT
jgi:hypothetical protein